eukprot:gene41068-54403_t
MGKLGDQDREQEQEVLGRRGPSAVLGEYMALAKTYDEIVYFKETAVATTLVHAFVLAKYVFYNNKVGAQMQEQILSGLNGVANSPAVTNL